MSDAPADTQTPATDDEVAIEIPIVRFDLAHDTRVEPFSRLFGVRRDTGYVELAGLTFRARFGPWLVETPIDNIDGVEITGPYRWHRVVGPARWSPTDRGLTFATTTERGVLVRFVEPVRGLDAFGWLRHPTLTLTVARPEPFVEALEQTGRDAEVIERDEHDQLQAMTTHELRALARQHDLDHPSSLKKAELVERLREVIEQPSA